MRANGCSGASSSGTCHASLTDRPKQGFGVPIDAWLRGPLRGWAQDLLSHDRLAREGYLRPGPVQAALRDHLWAGATSRHSCGPS